MMTSLILITIMTCLGAQRCGLHVRRPQRFSMGRLGGLPGDRLDNAHADQQWLARIYMVALGWHQLFSRNVEQKGHARQQVTIYCHLKIIFRQS